MINESARGVLKTFSRCALKTTTDNARQNITRTALDYCHHQWPFTSSSRVRNTLVFDRLTQSGHLSRVGKTSTSDSQRVAWLGPNISLYQWSCSERWCLAEVVGYWNGVQRRPMGPCGMGMSNLFINRRRRFLMLNLTHSTFEITSLACKTSITWLA